MDAKLIREIQAELMTPEKIAAMPDIKTGMEVEVTQAIREGGKERSQKFKGLVIRTAGKTPTEKVIVVRKDVDGIGVEKTFPLLSPTTMDIKILRQFKVSRANIGFIRKLTGKAARLKEVRKEK